MSTKTRGVVAKVESEPMMMMASGGTAAETQIERMLATEALSRKERDQSLLSCSSPSLIACAPNLVWREKVVQWCYDVVDYLGESRSLVYVAMNILDRFCALHLQTNTMDERTYEVSSLSAIFLSLRVSGSDNLRLLELASMSRGDISAKDISLMGTEIVHSLTWNHRLFTPSHFINSFKSFLPSHVAGTAATATAVTEMAHYLAEIAVCDVQLSHFKPSELALAAMMNALKINNAISAEINAFSKALQRTTLNTMSRRVTDISLRLENAYKQSAESATENGPHIVGNDDENEVIPTDTCRSSDDSKMTSDVPLMGVAHSVSLEAINTLSEDTLDETNCSSAKHHIAQETDRPLKRAKIDLSNYL